MTNSQSNIKNLTLSALCLAIAMLLPFLTGQIQTIGQMLCPMHIPIFLCAFICDWKWAGAIGFISPLLRSAWLGMPPMMMALGMSFEMAAYGIIAALLYAYLPKKNSNVYVSLIISMIAGRIVWGIARVIISGVTKTPFTWELFISGALLEAIPGIILHIVLIPIIVIALRRAKLIG